MKNILLILSVLLLFSCSKSPEQKAQKAVTNYLQQNLDDWKSYESIGFGSIDSTMSLFDQDFAILIHDSINLNALFNTYLESSIEYGDMKEFDKAKEFVSEAEKLTDSIKKVELQLNLVRKEYKPSFDGWIIRHKYRAKNKQGNYEVFEKWFHIYKDFSGAKEI